MLAGASACTGDENKPPPSAGDASVDDASTKVTYSITSSNLAPAAGVTQSSGHRVVGALRVNTTQTATSSTHRVNGHLGPLGR